MAQGVALISPLADHDLPATPHIEPIQSCFRAAGVISDDPYPTALKSTYQLPHGAGISSWLAAMKGQHDHKSQDVKHHPISITTT
jgi:hypothetical protein